MNPKYFMDNHNSSLQTPNQYKSLNFVYFSAIPNWSASAILSNQLDYRDNFKLIKIGKLIRKVRDSVKIEDDKLYQRVTIKIQGRGVLERDKEIGKNIGTKNQFRISAGQFIMSKIDARNGAFGIVPKELDGATVTQDFLTYTFNTNLIIPEFFVFITTTKLFYDLCQRASSGTTNRQRIDEKLFLNFEMPLPSLNEQNQLANAYSNKILEALRQEKEAKRLEISIEESVIQFLSIEKSVVQKCKGINFIQFKEIVRWGVDTNLNADNPSTVLESSIFPNIPLKRLIEINPKVSFSNFTEISFVPMNSVSDETGEILKKKIAKTENAKGYTKFKEGDLLWAKITPCMENGKSAIANNLLNGFGYGSTEFYVLRPISKIIDIDYLHLLLRLELVKKKATAFFTGSAGQQRVPKFFLEDLNIPVPPIEIQKKFIFEIKELKNTINNLKIESQTNRSEAIANFEKALFKI
jgi:type I restriction enzyme, S subunit